MLSGQCIPFRDTVKKIWSFLFMVIPPVRLHFAYYTELFKVLDDLLYNFRALLFRHILTSSHDVQCYPADCAIC